MGYRLFYNVPEVVFTVQSEKTESGCCAEGVCKKGFARGSGGNHEAERLQRG